MKSVISWALVFTVLLISACGGGEAVEAPAKEEILQKVVGTYCGDNSRLKLILKEDGSYVVQRSRKSPSGVGILLEKASGPFELKLDEEKGEWSLNFGTSTKNSNPFLSVDASSQVIWKSEGGYLIGSDQVSLQEPLEKSTVTPQNCIELE